MKNPYPECNLCRDCGLPCPVLRQKDTSRRVPTGTLVRPDVCVIEAAWSPDGEQIAFTRFQSERFNFDVSPPDLVLLSPNENTRHILHDGEAIFGIGYNHFETRIQWSPDGKWILYSVRANANDLYLWAIRADGSITYDYSAYIEYDPTVVFWSADSQSVYLRLVEHDLESRTIHLRKLTLDSNAGPIDISPVQFEDTVWVYPTPNGGEMLALADDKLWLANLDTGDEQFITATDRWLHPGFISIRWSSDREWIAVLGKTRTEQAVVQIMRLDGSEMREYSINVDDGRRVPEENQQRVWYISDFNWPHSIRLVSSFSSGFHCTIDLFTDAITCLNAYDPRLIIHPPQ